MTTTQRDPIVPGSWLGNFVDWDLEDPTEGEPQLVFTYMISEGPFEGRRAPIYMQTSSDAAREFVLKIVEAMSGKEPPDFATFIAYADRVLTPRVCARAVRLVFENDFNPNTKETRCKLKYVNRAAYGFASSMKADKTKREQYLAALQLQADTRARKAGANGGAVKQLPKSANVDSDAIPF